MKEFDNVLIPEEDLGLFYTHEAYVLRWGYEITVVRELEGLTPGSGPFARDRIYQKKLQEQKEGKTADKEVKKTKRILEDSDSECSETEGDDEYQRVLESGGRERCAYFFWQGAWSHDTVMCSYDTVYRNAKCEFQQPPPPPPPPMQGSNPRSMRRELLL